ncbi:hypothetical protein [Cognatilysobacter lacus]|uniref:Uncharacterized protein n=1 Tax=Cognatilysobacter lacus TaxID=1643323 RepID=A0A5D8Z4P5_9GAMM|nr:hypothetical protein [Lysobacter lacus]TZF89516.1 hypothetical protein FW784_08675 [Lysobacter lacus]
MDVQHEGHRDAGVLSRGELELELASLALAVTRSARERVGRPRSAERLLAATVDSFLAAALRLLARTRRVHRAWVVGRLCEIAASAQLGIIGFEEWLASHEPDWRRTSDKWLTVESASRRSSTG